MKMYIITKTTDTGADFDVANDFTDSEVEHIAASGHVDDIVSIATYVCQSCPRNEDGLFLSEQSIIDAVYEALHSKVYEQDSSTESVQSLVEQKEI